MSVRVGGSGVVVVHDRPRWWARSIDGDYVGEGEGSLLVPGARPGESALVEATTVTLPGGRRVALPGFGEVKDACWWGDDLVVVRGGDEFAAGLWSVDEFEPPRRMPFAGRSVAMGNGRLVVESPWSGAYPDIAWRFVAIGRRDAVALEDATPDLEGVIGAYSERGRVRVASVASRYDRWRFITVDFGGRGWEVITGDDDRLGPGVAVTFDGQAVFESYDGVRSGIVFASARGPRRSVFDADASLTNPTALPDGRIVVVRHPVRGGSVSLVAVGPAGDFEPFGRPLPILRRAVTIERWSGPAGPLEGLLSPVPVRPRGIVVDLHGGPWHSLVAGQHDSVARWCDAGFIGFAPEYAASGIGGRSRFEVAEQDGRLWDPAVDPDVLDVSSAIVHIAARFPNLPVFLIGHSYGCVVVNRILSSGARLHGAVCWESGVNGLPEDRARAARGIATPVLLVAGTAGLYIEDNRAWLATLHETGADADIYEYEGGHVAEGATLEALTARCIEWFGTRIGAGRKSAGA